MAGEEIERILEEQRIKALHDYLKLVKTRAQQTGDSVLEIIGSDLADATNGRIGLRPRDREKLPEPKAITTVYSFSTPHGNLIYYPQRRIAVSPLLPEGNIVNLSQLRGLLLKTFIQNPAAVYTTAELTSLIPELGQAPTPNESNRTGVLIYRLRRNLGEDVSEKVGGRYFGRRLIYTTPAGYTLVPNLHNYANRSCPEKP